MSRLFLCGLLVMALLAGAALPAIAKVPSVNSAVKERPDPATRTPPSLESQLQEFPDDPPPERITLVYLLSHWVTWAAFLFLFIAFMSRKSKQKPHPVTDTSGKPSDQPEFSEEARRSVLNIVFDESLKIFRDIRKEAKAANVPLERDCIEFCCRKLSSSARMAVLLHYEVWEKDHKDAILPVLKRADQWVGIHEPIPEVAYLPASLINELVYAKAIHSLDDILEQHNGEPIPLGKIDMAYIPPHLTKAVNYFLLRGREISSIALCELHRAG